MIVLSAPGSSASRKRSGVRGSSSEYTALIWWGSGSRSLVDTASIGSNRAAIRIRNASSSSTRFSAASAARSASGRRPEPSSTRCRGSTPDIYTDGRSGLGRRPARPDDPVNHATPSRPTPAGTNGARPPRRTPVGRAARPTGASIHRRQGRVVRPGPRAPGPTSTGDECDTQRYPADPKMIWRIRQNNHLITVAAPGSSWHLAR